MDTKQVVVDRNIKKFDPMGLTEEDFRLLQFIAADDTAVALSKISKHMEMQESEGNIDEINVGATPQEQTVDFRGDPLVPWITASLYNNGPNTVYLMFNYQDNIVSLRNGQGMDVDFTISKLKLELIRYWCNAGETAQVTVKGKY